MSVCVCVLELVYRSIFTTLLIMYVIVLRPFFVSHLHFVCQPLPPRHPRPASRSISLRWQRLRPAWNGWWPLPLATSYISVAGRSGNGIAPYTHTHTDTRLHSISSPFIIIFASAIFRWRCTISFYIAANGQAQNVRHHNRYGRHAEWARGQVDTPDILSFLFCALLTVIQRKKSSGRGYKNYNRK